MKKTLLFVFSLTLIVAFSVGIQYVFALTTYVDSVESFTQGLKKNGGPITDPARTDPTKALGPEDGQFVSLGYDGTLVLEFPLTVGGTLTITTFETTWGSYPEENAEVWVSEDGTSFDLIGTAGNLVNQPSQDPHPSVFDLGSRCVRYVKLIDVTDPNLHGATSDGFDVDAVRADYTEECLEEPCCETIQINVGNDWTFVKNNITAISNTGGNRIANSWNQKGGFSGNISSNNDDNSITTGNATAYAGAINVVNSNVALNDDECCGSQVQVSAGNDFTGVKNEVTAVSDTGDNSIAESSNQMGGFSGNISSNNDGNTIVTGNATAKAGAINIVNSNINRTFAW